MHPNDIERIMRQAEEAFERELRIVEEILGHSHPRHKHHRFGGHGELLFLFTFSNLQILEPMALKKVIGLFTGKLVFKNAEGQVQPVTGLVGVALTVNDDTIGNVALTLNPDGTPDGTFSGNGVAPGDLVITAAGTNDAGNPVTGTNTITFAADTTVTDIDVNIDQAAAQG